MLWMSRDSPAHIYMEAPFCPGPSDIPTRPDWELMLESSAEKTNSPSRRSPTNQCRRRRLASLPLDQVHQAVLLGFDAIQHCADSDGAKSQRHTIKCGHAPASLRREDRCKGERGGRPLSKRETQQWPSNTARVAFPLAFSVLYVQRTASLSYVLRRTARLIAREVASKEWYAKLPFPVSDRAETTPRTGKCFRASRHAPRISPLNKVIFKVVI